MASQKRLKLTEDHAKARLQWAPAHKDWTVEDFQRVIHTNECSVEQVPAGHQRWVFRTPQEKWHKDCILPKNCRQVKLMVWGCFWGNQRGPLVPLMPANGSVTARFYRSLLRRWLLPVLEDIPLFQQDNARIHTAKLMLSFFEQYNIPLEFHPPYSPDLNPIEHAWVLLKRQAHIDYPWIGDYPQKVKKKLAEILPLCWEKILPSNSRPCGGQCLTGAGSHRGKGVVHSLLISFEYLVLPLSLFLSLCIGCEYLRCVWKLSEGEARCG